MAFYMIFDNPEDKKNMSFLDRYKHMNIEFIYPKKKCNSIQDMLRECNHLLRRSNKGDTIICWYDFMAVLCWVLCKILFKKRKIFALNILLKDKSTIKNRLAKLLYKAMLSSKCVKATVTSRKYGAYLNNLLKLHRSYYLLHDLYHGDYDIGYKGGLCQYSVFCGGRNGRNWPFLIELAKSLPEVTFNCVMPKVFYETFKKSFSGNMRVKCDISEREFLEQLCQSKLVVMPLDTEAPAGLIVFYQAAANNIMSITSNTVTTQEYLSDGRGVLCNRDVENWKREILYYLNNSVEADKCAKNLKRYLEEECSEDKFAITLWNYLNNER